MKTVLVLCTGNSCRSQMAEVILNHDLAGSIRAISAGTQPQPKVALEAGDWDEVGRQIAKEWDNRPELKAPEA